MERNQFLKIATAVAEQAQGDRTRIGNLILRNAGHELREPQLRHLFALECDRQGQYYAFEAPTLSKYDFSGKKGHYTTARHDLVLFDVAFDDTGEHLTKALVELKQGLAPQNFKTDMVKLLKETAQANVTGAAFVVVTEHASVGALTHLFEKIPQVAADALADSHSIDERQRVTIRESNGWFEFMTIIRSGKQPGLWRAGDLLVKDLVSGQKRLAPELVDL